MEDGSVFANFYISQFASVVVRSDIRLTWDERTEVEEAEPAAAAALRCGARRVDQIANLNQYSF